jgi:hypothetical protein
VFFFDDLTKEIRQKVNYWKSGLRIDKGRVKGIILPDVAGLYAFYPKPGGVEGIDRFPSVEGGFMHFKQLFLVGQPCLNRYIGSGKFAEDA